MTVYYEVTQAFLAVFSGTLEQATQGLAGQITFLQEMEDGEEHRLASEEPSVLDGFLDTVPSGKE